MPEFRSALANHKILRQKLLQITEPTHVLKHIAADSYGATQRETHSFNHARDHYTTKEFSIHSNGFQSRPQTLARNRPIGAADQSDVIVLKLLGQMSEQGRCHAYITVTHYQYVVIRFTDHAIQTEGLGIGNRGLAGYDDPRGDPSAKLGDNFFRHGHGRIVRAVDAEQNFIFGIILQHETAKVLFQAIVMAAERLKNADRRGISRCRQSRG